MPYSTITNLIQACGGAARLQNISDWDNTRVTGTVPINTAITSSDALIDSYLRKQYAVPLTAPIPQPVVEVSARMTKYRLMSARGMVDTQTRDDYRDDVKWLEGVAAGSITLGINPDAAPSGARVDSSTPRPVTKDVSRRKMWGFS